MKLKNLLLIPYFLLIPFKIPNSFLPKNELKPVKEIVFNLDSCFSKYRKDFKNECDFWKIAFTLDSSKSLLYKKETMKILDTISTPKEIDDDEKILDSIHKINNAELKTFGIIYGRKQKMQRAAKRALNHLDYIIDSLEAHNLPTSLAVIPYFESEFKNESKSKAGAVGMWQFRKATAREYGLIVNEKIDERKDSKKSLSAFIKYMEDSYSKFDNDLLALVSYNTGRNSCLNTSLMSFKMF
jgi:hypothetical protein